MRGKGFLYLASDRGPNAYDGGPSVISEPWGHDGLAYLMLLHEFGHIFGLAHQGALTSASFQGRDLMAENSADFILSKAHYSIFEGIQRAIPFFHPPHQMFRVALPADSTEFLLPEHPFGTLGVDRTDPLHIKLSTRDSLALPWRDLGTLVVRPMTPNPTTSRPVSWAPAQLLKLPPGQTALTIPPGVDPDSIAQYGPGFESWEFPATLTFASGGSKSVVVNIGPGSFKLFGESGGETSVFNY